MSNRAVAKDGIVIERTFNAPVSLIWRLWTEVEEFKKWYGPQGFTTVVAEMDVRVGGKRLICMVSPDGRMKLWTTGEYREIVPQTRLVYTDCPADEQGKLRSLADMGIGNDARPFITEVTVQLAEVNGRTTMLMTHTGLPAGDQGASAGWEQSFAKLAAQAEGISRTAA